MDINIVDFHSHILPRIDDGSHSVEESIKMLEMEATAGIKTMAATPHFYPDSDTPSRFLARRAEAFEKLQEKLTDALPKILLGAEIAYFEGMRNCEELKHLAISETRLVLIEMPMKNWTERMLSEVLFSAENLGLTPLIAHIDRYNLGHEELKLVKDFVNQGGMVQANASAFLHFATCAKTIKMIKNGIVHLLGSDCHNIISRPPNLKEAIEKITGKTGNAPLKIIEEAQNFVFSKMN